MGILKRGSIYLSIYLSIYIYIYISIYTYIYYNIYIYREREIHVYNYLNHKVPLKSLWSLFESSKQNVPFSRNPLFRISLWGLVNVRAAGGKEGPQTATVSIYRDFVYLYWLELDW